MPSEADELRDLVKDAIGRFETAMPEARAAFLAFMEGVGFQYEIQDSHPKIQATQFFYRDEAGMRTGCGDWFAALEHFFRRQNLAVDPVRIDRST